MRLRGRVLTAVAVVATVLVWIGMVFIGRADRAEPVRIDIQAGDGVPVTLYLPGEPDEHGLVPLPARGGDPVVVVAHGFSADRRAMHAISTSLAEHGYVAASIDFRGHGASRQPFRGDIVADVIEVMDTLESVVWVDGSRMALLGHSMGAGAVLDAATRDRRPRATVAISGGRVGGDVPASNVLLLVAEDDPQGIHVSTERIFQRLGRLGAERQVIEGTDHLSILFSDEAISETIGWLDQSFGISRPEPIEPSRGPFRLMMLTLLAAVVVIAAIGWMAGRAGPELEIRRGGTAAGLGALVLASVVAAPILGVAPVASFLPLEVFDSIVSYQILVAGLILGAATLRPRHDERSSLARQAFSGTWASLPVALAAFAAIYVLLAPILGVVHRAVPTPERLVAWVLASVLLFVFFAPFEALLRRGETWAATLGAVIGRVILLAALLIGASVGILPGVVLLAVPLLVVLFVLIEVFATFAYAAGRNPVLIAVVESLWLGWVVAVSLPITI